MPNDKEKLLSIMGSLEKDYKDGKISKGRYDYFKAKYQDRLRYLDKYEATNRIRSMQGKPTNNKQKKSREQFLDKQKKEKEDLVQKYIINPKNGDKDFNKKKKKELDSGTYKLTAILVLVIAFTIGIAVGIFALDFEDMSAVNSDALVVDTSFPDLSNLTVEINETSSNHSKVVVVEEDVYDSGSNSEGSELPNSGGGEVTPIPEQGGESESSEYSVNHNNL